MLLQKLQKNMDNMMFSIKNPGRRNCRGFESRYGRRMASRSSSPNMACSRSWGDSRFREEPVAK